MGKVKLNIPNHTQIPNTLIDDLMKDLSGSEIKVILAICRKTIGWHKISDRISLTQLAELTGLSRKSVATAIPTLEDAGLISVDRSGNTNKYDINYTSEKNTLVEKVHQGGEKNSPVTGEKITHTKDISSKETLTKETARASGDFSDEIEKALVDGKLTNLVKATDDLNKLLQIYQAYRRANDKQDNDFTVNVQRQKFKEMGVKRVQAAMLNSIGEGWTKLVEPDESKSDNSFDPTGRPAAGLFENDGYKNKSPFRPDAIEL